MRSLSGLVSTSPALLSALTLIAVLFPSDNSKQKSAPSGPLPNCNAGAAQVVECQGAVAVVQLDATGSTNPAKGPLTYKWEICNDPRLSIDDPTSATPLLFVDLQGTCSLTCTVGLAVRNKFGVSNCSTSVTVQDTTAPAITCPPDATVLQGDPTDPSVTGSATATDLRNPNPAIAYVDDLSQGPDTLLRVWSADDGCQSSSCIQTITIAPRPIAHAHFDIRPGFCPNPIEVQGSGGAVVILTTSLLGNDFDVTQVDLGSVVLKRSLSSTDGSASVPPKEMAFEDSGTPFEGAPCGCNTLGSDGILDLNVHFNKFDVVSTLALDQEPNGTVVELELSGLLWDRTPFTATDCIVIYNR
ncbi:MAG: hypothetical protein K8S98_00315 [Planctomycetes bacterium]|nr:hypothetical protein [Planctomycetota bacterium]